MPISTQPSLFRPSARLAAHAQASGGKEGQAAQADEVSEEKSVILKRSLKQSMVAFPRSPTQ